MGGGGGWVGGWVERLCANWSYSVARRIPPCFPFISWEGFPLNSTKQENMTFFFRGNPLGIFEIYPKAFFVGGGGENPCGGSNEKLLFIGLFGKAHTHRENRNNTFRKRSVELLEIFYLSYRKRTPTGDECVFQVVQALYVATRPCIFRQCL